MYKNFMILSSVLILSTMGCTHKQASINIAGSTTVLPVVSRAAETFAQLHKIRVIVNAGGSGVGINQLGEGKLDIGMASRKIDEEEITRYPKVNFVRHAIGRDAVVPVVSSEVYAAGITALTLKQIGAIYLGQIRNWKQLGGADKDILVVDKEASRGTRHVFMEAVLGDKNAKAPGADLVLGANNEEQTAIAQSDAAIGMLSNAWLNADVKGLAIVLTNGDLVQPTLENIINNSFPTTRSLWLITNGEPKGMIKAFIDYVLSPQGQKIVRESGYVGLAG